MFAKFGKDLVSRDLIEAVKKVMDQPDEDKDDQTEELKGGQVKLDKNHNGKLDSHDFKILRGEKKGVAEAEDTTKKYEMMHRNGQVKRFVAKDDADAKRIAAGHGAKSVIRMKSNVPGDKIKEQGVAEAAEPDYKSSAKYRGKVGDFKPKASDVGQGRKIVGKMGKYGKQPDDDEKMVEPPKDHTVGAVKTDPSAVVPGHSTMAAKLHLASLPKDKEGNPIVKGARKVSAADLVAKRKAMMSQKNEAIEDTLHPAGAALLKHIKPQHHNLYKPHLTKDTFNGSYGDRTAVLKAAKDAGHLKMDLRKQNEEVESITEGKMDKMTLSGLWHKHAQHSYLSDQGYGLGSGSMHHNDHAATAIENHVRKHYGNKVADDMVSHSEHHVAHAEYAGQESAPHHEKEADKLRKKHGIHGDLYGESVSHVTEKIDPNVRTTDTLKGRIAGGDSNQHTSYKVKLETKGTGAMDRIKSAAKSAFDRVKNETMMGKAGATSEAKKLDKEGY